MLIFLTFASHINTFLIKCLNLERDQYFEVEWDMKLFFHINAEAPLPPVSIHYYLVSINEFMRLKKIITNIQFSEAKEMFSQKCKQ